MLWFALQTKSRCEKKVEYLLTQKGYECFLPTYQQKRQWSDRIVELELPLFPTYVFCCFVPSAIGKAVLTPGINRIVGFGGSPIAVPAKEIEALQLLARSSLLREPWEHIPIGAMIQVETGPLAGVQGILTSVDNKRRLVVSVTLLQRSVAIQLDKDTLLSVISNPKRDRNKRKKLPVSDVALNLI